MTTDAKSLAAHSRLVAVRAIAELADHGARLQEVAAAAGWAGAILNYMDFVMARQMIRQRLARRFIFELSALAGSAGTVSEAAASISGFSLICRFQKSIVPLTRLIFRPFTMVATTRPDDASRGRKAQHQHR